MNAPRRLPRRGVGGPLLAVALAGVLVTPAWFILIEESRRPSPAPADPRGPIQALATPPPPAPPPPTSAPTPGPPPRPDDGPMPVRGRVLDRSSGLPLDGLAVVARRATPAEAEAGPQAGERAVSGQDGRFELSLLPGAWLVACEGGAREELVKVLPGSGAELELLALRPPQGPLLRLLDPDGRPLTLPAALVSVVGADGARLEARPPPAGEGGVRLPPLPAAAELRVWPGDPRWLPWRGQLPPGPLEVRLRPAPGLPLRLRLADEHLRADVQVFDPDSGAVLAQRIAVGPPGATSDGDERALLWTGPGLATALPDGGREVRVVVGLSAETPGPLRVVVTAHRPLRHGQAASQALSRVERRLPAGQEALLDLR